MNAPKKWKMAIVVWIAIYPTITLLFITLDDRFSQIDFLPLRTLVITFIVVPLMSFVIIPLLQRVAGGWLKK